MLRSSSSSSSSAQAPAPSSPQSESEDDNDDDEAYTPVRFTGNVRLSTTPGFPNSYSTKRLLQEYNDHLITTDEDPRNWVLFVRRYIQLKDRTDIPLVAIFGWTTRGPSRSLSNARPDIATGSPSLMHALYLLAVSHFDAKVTIPTYMGYWNPTDFMTFDPVHPNYKAPNTPGSYISMTSDISRYYQYILAIKRLKNEPEHEILLSRMQ
jgi:hypothetical protein